MIVSIKWTVIHGKKLWRKIWYKTANIKVESGTIDEWVYKIRLSLGGEIYSGVGTYIAEKWLFESHIFDFDMDIYDRNLEVILLYKIRDNKKFDSLDDLVAQIKTDIETAKNKTDYVLTFWAFDLLHLGHEHYLSNAKKYWDFLITIVGTDKNIEKLKGKAPDHSQEERKKTLESVEISDKVIIWNEDNPMKWIDTYRPLSICLWYDQAWFADKIESYLKENNIVSNIIRLWALEPGKFKSSILKKLRKNNA